jgi:hypothetical protein
VSNFSRKYIRKVKYKIEGMINGKMNNLEKKAAKFPFNIKVKHVSRHNLAKKRERKKGGQF